MVTTKFIAAIVAFVVCSSVAADEKPALQPGRVIGAVYGKTITAADIKVTEPAPTDIKFDARDEELWNLSGRILAKFGKPISNRFIEEHKIEVTPEEIAKFKETSRRLSERSLIKNQMRLANLKEELAAPELSEEKRAKLQEELKSLERILPHQLKATTRDTPDEIAQTLIKNWKVERELHRKYGGRVIFQQFGLEALDARRELFQEAENKGDLKFDDAGVRYMFYYYYANMRHSVVDEDALEKPWFFATDRADD